jgi:hypothetical protein
VTDPVRGTSRSGAQLIVPEVGWTTNGKSRTTQRWIGEQASAHLVAMHTALDPHTSRTVQIAASACAGVGMGRLFLEYVEAPCDVTSEVAQPSASWRSGGFSRRQATPQLTSAPASLGQAAGRDALAGHVGLVLDTGAMCVRMPLVPHAPERA